MLREAAAESPGYAVMNDAAWVRNISRFDRVERITRSRSIRRGRPAESIGQASADGSESALSAAQRSSCSTLLRSEWTSVETINSRARTRSITPRAGRRTGTSINRRQLGSRLRIRVSTMAAWCRSRIDGPVVGYRRRATSRPRTEPSAARVARLGSRRPRSVRERNNGSIRAAAATSRIDSSASRRMRRRSSPTLRRSSSAIRPVEVRGSRWERGWLAMRGSKRSRLTLRFSRGRRQRPIRPSVMATSR